MTTYGTIDDLIASPQANFSRPSPALMPDAEGVYRSFADDVPRRINGVGLLTTVGRTNYNTRFSYTPGIWAAGRGSLSAIPFTLFGGVDAARLTLDGGNDPLTNIQPVVNTIGSRTFTASFWARIEDSKGMTGDSQLLMYGATGVEQVKTFTFQPTSEWQRFEFTATFSDAVSTELVCRIDPWGVNHNNSPVAGAQMDIGGWQLEEGPFATDPIITEGSAETREDEELRLYPAPGTYDIIVTFDNDSAQTFADQVIDGDGWLLPVASLNRPLLKSIRAVAAD